MDDLSVVIVSYEQDFDLAISLIESIREHGIGDGIVPIHLIVNDKQHVFEKFKNVLKDVEEVHVKHCFELSDWVLDLDWVSQQWYKLDVSNIIETKWYLVLDSDQIQTEHAEYEDLFDGIKAKCLLKETTLFDENTNMHRSYKNRMINACNLLGVDFSKLKLILSETTPVLMHTQTVRKLTQKCNQNVFYDQSCANVAHPCVVEFFLYWIYVVRENLTGLYSTENIEPRFALYDAEILSLLDNKQ